MTQIGTDRIIELQFSDGAYRLFLEFYAGGNIVLTDGDLSIIALLRNVSEGEEHEQYKLGLSYNLSLRQNYGGIPALTKERVRAGLLKAVDKQLDAELAPGGKKKLKRKAGDALRKALAVSINEFPPVLLDHALQVTGFDKNITPQEVLESDEVLDRLMPVFDVASKVLADMTSTDTAKGYIVAKGGKSGTQDGAEAAAAAAEKAGSGLMYDDFHPFKPAQLESNPENTFLEFEGFNKTVDEFFSSIEGQKLESKLNEREENAKRKLEQARQEHEKRLGGLQQVQELNVRRAQAIEANLDRVEEAIAAVNGLIAQGMDWVEIGRLIEMEQKRGNPVAETIKLPLKLEENTATLLLSEFAEAEDEEMDDVTDSEPSDSEDEETQAKKPPQHKAEDKRLAVDIDLGLSPWSNARQYYDQRRVAATKQERTEQASQKALRSTEQKIAADLKKGLKQEKDVLRPVRKQMWFEKFIYFISSDGYLVLGGKDAQQNEILYRRYLKKGDVYVHADLHGAATVIIKNNPETPDAPIPPSTLSQAGNLSVCTSSAWDSKAVMSAWWVNADQVSKTAPTGEYLTTGGFMVRGKKNFLPPAQLLLGFAVMFKISDESKARHVKHRLRDGGESAPKAQSAKDLGQPTAEADDEDDEFPDAQKEDADEDDDFPDANGKDKAESEDDEFPDAQDGEASSAEEDEEKGAQRANPLQTNRSAGRDASTEKGSGLEDSSADEEQHTPPAEFEAQAEADEVDGEDTSEESAKPAAKPSGIRHLSARERRLQRQGKSIDAAPGADSEDDAPPSKKSAGKKAAAPAPKPAQPTRGKRGKAKKAAQKYADQDEEERRIAMELLGVRPSKEKAVAEAAEKPEKTESVEEQRARRRAQHEEAQRKGLEAEEIRRLNIEEGVEALDDEEEKAMTQLDALVGDPLPGDELLEAIPVCAPWAALAKYKYKAKLQPGAQKKGKAVREILANIARSSTVSKWVDEKAQDKEKIWPREIELIKGWKEPEVIGVIPVSKVRVMMAGGSGGGAAGGKAGAKGKGGGRGGKGSKRK